jgi:enterochelin esterase family protein
MIGTITNNDNSITFYYHHFDADYVAVCGTFSDWKPVYLNRGNNGWWYFTTPSLDSGNYEYKFVVNGEWVNDQYNFRINNDTNNSLINVGGQIGHLIKRSFFSPVLGVNKKYTIYLPPSYNYSNKSYPTVYLMAGLLDNEETWTRKGYVDRTLDYLIGTEQIGEMVVVMPDKDDTCFHEHEWSRYASYLVNDLISHIESEYKVIKERQFRGLEGLSLGAAWTLRLISYFPEVFKCAAIDSGFTDKNTVSKFNENLETFRNLKTRFYLSCGTSEPDLIDLNNQFSSHIKNNGIHCENYVFDGPHDWELWVQVPRSSMMFHYYSFQL